MARSQLKLYKHPEDEHLRVLVQDKSNLGQLSPSLLFEVVQVEENLFRLEWHGETPLTIAEVEGTQKRPKLEAAEAFLRQKLADGPKLVTDLIEQAKGTCSKRTLDEAKKSLELVTERKGKGHGHKVSWALPAVAPTEEAAAKGCTEAKGTAGEVRENRPAQGL